MLSLCIKGEREFPASRLRVLLARIDPANVLQAVGLDAWLAALRAFEEAFISAHLIDGSERESGRLSDKLCALKGTDDFAEVVKKFRRTHEAVNQFEKAFLRISPELRSRFEETLHKFITQERRKNARTGSADLAGDILARMVTCKVSNYGYPLIGRPIRNLNPKEVGSVEALCYFEMAHGREEPFVDHVKRMIDDVDWRREDLKVRVPYYRGFRNIAWQIDRHLRTRPSYLHAHDVGRAIVIYSALIQEADMLDLAETIREEIMRSIGELGLGPVWRRKVESLLAR